MPQAAPRWSRPASRTSWTATRAPSTPSRPTTSIRSRRRNEGAWQPPARDQPYSGGGVMRSAWGAGIATYSGDKVLEVFYPAPHLDGTPDDPLSFPDTPDELRGVTQRAVLT